MLVYALLDPRTEQVRYVGQTRQDLRLRLRQHVAAARRGTQHVNYWVASLLRDEVRPIIALLEAVESQDALDLCEMKWITHYLEQGCDLCNKTQGGRGGGPRNASAELRARYGELSRAYWTDPDYRARQLARLRDVPVETREIIGSQSRARWADPIWAAKQRELLRTDEYRAKRRALAAVYTSGQRKCNDCDRVSNPQNMGRHLAHTGHGGFTVLDAVSV